MSDDGKRYTEIKCPIPAFWAGKAFGPAYMKQMLTANIFIIKCFFELEEAD